MDDADLPDLEPQEYRRYGRHLSLPEVGIDGQRRLKAGSALVVGAGGLGSPIGLYLAAAGVGRITLCDFDVVDPSNLQRQILFGTRDLGRNKAAAGAERLRDVNPLIEVRGLEERVSSENVLALVRDHDIVLDGSDNFSTRYLVNDACVIEDRPLVYGSIFRFEGQTSLFHAARGPCYRCLFPEPPPDGLVPNCAQAGVLGVLPGVIGGIQAAEALKFLLGRGDSLLGRLLLVDTLGTRFREVRLRKDPACPACGENATIREAVEAGGYLCPTRDAAAGSGTGIAPAELARRIASETPPFLLDVREPWEFLAGSLAGATNVPLGEVATRVEELPADRDLVLFCSIGPRGERAAELLRERGIARAENLAGGLRAWRDQVDAAFIVA